MKSKSKNNEMNSENAQAAMGAAGDSTVEVLYQRMGDRWFAFSLVGEEVFVGSISQSEVDTLQASNPGVFARTGHS